MDKKFKKISLLIIFITILILIYVLFKKFHLLDIDFLKSYVKSLGIFGPLAFIVIYIIFALTSFPATVLTISAGIIFGLWYGLLYVVIAATLAATIAFYIARYYREKFIEDRFKSKTFKKIVTKIEDHAEKRGFFIITILRLSFMPFIPLSYASGLVKKLKAKDFILATILTDIIGSFVFIYLGFSITKSIPYFLLGVCLLILFLHIPKLVKIYHNRK